MISKPHRRASALLALIATAGAFHLVEPASADSGAGSSSHGVSPVSPVTMVGEWSGIVPGQDAVVAMRIEQEHQRNVLALTEKRGEQIVTDVYPLVNLQVSQSGKFTASDRDAKVNVEGYAERDFGRLGAGHARVTLRGAAANTRVLDVELFLLAGESWMAKMLEFESKSAQHH